MHKIIEHPDLKICASRTSMRRDFRVWRQAMCEANLPYIPVCCIICDASLEYHDLHKIENIYICDVCFKMQRSIFVGK